MNASVILATYNQPEWLEKVIWGYAVQQHRQFEIVVADDGSTEDTAELIERLRKSTGLSIQHVWHEDCGFRKCRILNEAIVRARHEYLVFSDGDCIARHDFLSAHMRYAAPGRFLSGGLVRLPLDLSHHISISHIRERLATNFSWLRKNGLPLTRKSLLLTESPWRAKLLDRITTTRASWNGHNASGWKQDLLRVNGFDERMGYGGEDRELGERLMNLGIRPYQIRHQAVCVHLEHSRGYVSPEMLKWNEQHRKMVRRERRVRTSHGIDASENASNDRMMNASSPSQCKAEHAPRHASARVQESPSGNDAVVRKSA